MHRHFVFISIIIFMVLFLNSFTLFAQKPFNYERFRLKNLKGGCGVSDSTIIKSNIHLLESLSLNRLKKADLEKYYGDLAIQYYSYAITSKNKEIIRKALDTYQLLLNENPKSYQAHNDLSIMYILLLKDCVQGKKHLQLYKEVSGQNAFDEQQYNLLMNQCIENPIL